MQPERGFEGRFSMAYCLSLALLYGQLDPESFTDERARDPELRSVLGRVRHVPGSDSLVVHLKDGTTVTEPVRTPADLKGREAVLNKFNDSVDRILSEAQRAAVPDLVDRLEQSPSIEPLMEALRRQPAY
jgi:2-methylcitrate dehydratase PrpD